MHVKGQSWGFTSRSTARVILGQVLRIATCGTRTHRGAKNACKHCIAVIMCRIMPFKIYTEKNFKKYIGPLSFTTLSLSISIEIGDGTDTRSKSSSEIDLRATHDHENLLPLTRTQTPGIYITLNVK